MAMRPFGDLAEFFDARRRVLSAIVPIDGSEVVPLRHAGGRVLASEIRANADVPAFDRAAMDGYAMRAADAAGATDATPVRLPVVPAIYAGSGEPARLAAGQIAPIATGAMIPPGADAVLEVEKTRLTGVADTVEILDAPRPGRNIARAGNDLAAGDVAASAGQWLSSGTIGAVAAVGVAEVRVYRRPRVAFLTTGDEIVTPGTPLAPTEVYDINSYTIGRLVERHGGEALPQPNASDTLEAVERAIQGAVEAGADFVVTAGGASVGERDLIPAVAAALGDVVVHGVAIKPGKPFLFATLDRACLFGLPGYPTSALMVAHQFLVPALRHAARLPELVPRTVSARLEADVRSDAAKLQFLPMRLSAETDGTAIAANAFRGSGAITSLAHAQGYIVIPVGVGALDAGTAVDVVIFDG